MASTIAAPLAGKVAIVTGGSRGIGAATAKKLAEQGASHISITYTSKPAGAEATAKEIQKLNPSVKTTTIKADVLNDDFADKVVQGTLKGLQVDHIDIVVLNAALLLYEDLSKNTFERQLIGNAWNQFELAEAAMKVMPKGGRIIFMSSGASKFPAGRDTIAYACAKASVDAMSRNLAREYSASKQITFNSISIGATDTDAYWGNLEHLIPGETKDQAKRDQAHTMFETMSLLSRIAEVEEVANIVAFVASPGASWITGNQIPANGGALSALQS